ncbi:hypothetical protein [Burkholderia cenocepacia]|uniref:hypothetical protein n=1 Tax=Burkholderia cenocepacia TaxID=95486 RepID=UPI002ABE9912|nr:hypothetical protein [Burkholderia cenocepacia]
MTLKTVFKVITAVIGVLFGLTVAAVYIVMTLGGMAAVFLKLLEIPSVFDRIYPGAGWLQWFGIMLVPQVAIVGQHTIESACEGIAKWRNERLKRDNADALLTEIRQNPSRDPRP